MVDDVYRKLAQRLHAIPNGFTPTKSGVDLRLLAKIFEPEEAALAMLMSLTPETAATIGARAGLDERAAFRLLKGMVRKGQIEIQRRDGKLLFALLPFVFGIYEFQLPRIDAEMAQLFEEYLQETRGGAILHGQPSIHRVIPVRESISVDLGVFPYERAAELLDRAKSWGVLDCICRVQQKLVGRGCDHTVQNCMAFAPEAGLFGGGSHIRAISKQDALKILEDAAQEGLVHSTGNYRDGNFHICNCCVCCCGILRGISEFGIPSAIAHSDFEAVVDGEACIGCGECVGHCQLDALSLGDEVCEVDLARCIGCGVCTLACPTGALHLARRPADATPLPPWDNDEWLEQRADDRGVSLKEVRS
jgi:electron transport complex protein RnfB